MLTTGLISAFIVTANASAINTFGHSKPHTVEYVRINGNVSKVTEETLAMIRSYIESRDMHTNI